MNKLSLEITNEFLPLENEAMATTLNLLTGANTSTQTKEVTADVLCEIKVRATGVIPAKVAYTWRIGDVAESTCGTSKIKITEENIHEWLDDYSYWLLNDELIMTVDGFNLEVDGKEELEYELSCFSFEVIEDKIAEFKFGVTVKNLKGKTIYQAADQFEEIFTPDNIKLSNFIYSDTENDVFSEMEIVEVISADVDEFV